MDTLILWPRVAVAGALCAALLVACGQASVLSEPGAAAATPASIATVAPADAPMPEVTDKLLDQADCPNVDAALIEVAQAADPLAQARQADLQVQDGKIQVMVALAGQDTAFLADYGAEVTGQLGSDVQALVPIAQVCALARDDQVQAVRAPADAVPQ